MTDRHEHVDQGEAERAVHDGLPSHAHEEPMPEREGIDALIDRAYAAEARLDELLVHHSEHHAPCDWQGIDSRTGDIAGAVIESRRVDLLLVSLGFDRRQVAVVQQQIADLQLTTALTWRDATDQVLAPILAGEVTPSNLGGTDG